MRKLMTGLAATALLAVPALAQSQEQAGDPNLRLPQIYTFEQDGAQVEIVVGQAAFGDALTALGAAQAAEEENASVINEFWTRRNEVPPILLFEVARRSAADGNIDQAFDAYLLGRARTLYDALRCVDTSSLGVLDLASSFAGPEITQLMGADLGRTEAALVRLLDGGDMFSSEASPWWACSYGDSAYHAAVNNASMTGPEWLKVEMLWPEAQEMVQAYFVRDLTLVRETMASQQAGGD